MTFALLWFGFAAAVGILAKSKGQSGLAWFLIACVISPVLAGVLVLVMPDAKKEAAAERELAKAKGRK
jgi:hypothetical protein